MSNKEKYESALNDKFIKLGIHLNHILRHFPNYEKFGLSTKIREKYYTCYELFIEANKRYKKTTTLDKLDIEHEQLRMLIHLAKELEYFKYRNGKLETSKESEEVRRYLYTNDLIDQIGKMIGSWISKNQS